MSGQCVPSDASFTEPPPVDGKWGEWGKWKECSKKCGVGLRMRERWCNNPMYVQIVFTCIYINPANVFSIVIYWKTSLTLFSIF